jgi:4-amino-4-deoxy-L-arabinose transferase-like glycosyltransferase
MGLVLLLLLLCGVLFFHGLNLGELYQTEGLRALVATEMLRSGDWIVPTLYGEPLLTKPPGMYAVIALISWPFGDVTAAAARLPSALAATATVLLFYALFARRIGRRAGFVAASLLPASVMWLQRVPSAEIDLMQLAWVAAALLCFFRALEAVEAPPNGGRWREWAWWQGALLCVAGGFLTKWTAPAFFYLSVLSLLILRGQWRCLWRPPHLLAVVLAAALPLAWAAAVMSRTGGQPLLDAIAGEALPRLSPAHHARPYPWRELVTFPAASLAANLPWSALALATLWPGFARLWDERSRRLLQFFHCWTWPNLLFWTLVPGHHLRHALPLQPGLAGLAALVCVAWLDGRLRWPLRRLRPGRVLLAFLLLWLIVKLIFVHAIVPARDLTRQPRAKGEQLAALIPKEQTLYLGRVKDEGIMFYSGRAARRLAGPEMMPTDDEGRYCLLVESELQQWLARRPGEVLLRLLDEQGAPIVLVKISPAGRRRPLVSNPGEDDGPGNDERAANPVLPGQRLMKEHDGENDGDDNTELINRRHARRLAELERAEITQPGASRRQAREDEKQPRPRGDFPQWCGTADQRDGPGEDEDDRGSDRCRQVGVDVLDSHLRQHRRQSGEQGRQKRPVQPTHR